MADNYQRLPGQEDTDRQSLLQRARTLSISHFQQEEKEQYQHQKIDFKKELQNYRNRTEATREYTVQQVEDVMFIDAHRLVALEYIFYPISDLNQRSIYQELQVCSKDDQDDHHLGAEYYIADAQISTHAFREKPIIYDTNSERQPCYLNQNSDDHTFHQSSVAERPFKVECVISLWNISKEGTLMKYHERSFNYPFDFQSSEEDHMRLNLSDDKQFISLSSVDIKNDNSKIHFMAWQSSNLLPIILNEQLIQNISQPVQGTIRKIKFIGHSFYVLKEFMQIDKDKQGVHKYLVWQIFDSKNGEKVFERNNKYDESDEQSLRLIDVLPTIDMKKLGESSNNDSEDESSGLYNHFPTKEGQDQNEEQTPDILNLKLFYAKDAIKKPKKETNPKKKNKIVSPDDKWVVTLVTLNLQEIIKSCEQNYEDQNKLTDKEAKEQFKKFVKTYKTSGQQKEEFEWNKYFIVPKAWFRGKSKKGGEFEYKWESEISVTTNKSQDQFGFLNTQKKLFIAFDNTQDSLDNYASQALISKAIGKFVRNQQLKNELILIYRVENNTFGTMFRQLKDDSGPRTKYVVDKKMIYFKDDHMNGYQDVIAHKSKVSDQILLQSCTISSNDQDILLQTQIQTSTDEEGIKDDIVYRKSVMQYHQSNFPVLCYNIGLKTIVIHNTLTCGKKYLIKLNDNDSFVGFINYNKLDDIGFYQQNLKLEACSKFAFLTVNQEDRWNPKYQINFLIVDPYYKYPQIVLFKSSQVFYNADTIASDSADKKNLDTIVKIFIYNNKETEVDNVFDIKMIIQYSDHFEHWDGIVENEKEVKDEDEEESEMDDLNVHDTDEESEQEEESTTSPSASIPMVQDEQGHIYYILYSDGQTMIKEIIPAQDTVHSTIFELQSEKCLGFAYAKGMFYIMDDTKKINQLTRQNDSNELLEYETYTLKDKDWNKFIETKGQIDQMIMNDKYIIQGSKIFYLQGDKIFASGVLDMEDLKEDSWQFIEGPLPAKGNNEFIVIYKNTQENNWKTVIYQLPDSTETNLIGDYQHRVDMSTFLDNGQILLKVGNRFLLFENDGEFVDEVEFDDISKENEQKRKFQKLFKKQNQKNDGVNPSLNQDKHEDDEDDDDEQKNTMIVKQNEHKSSIYDDYNRMQLLKMSDNAKYFMFYDNILKKMRIYEIKKVDPEKEDSEYAFYPDYTLDVTSQDTKKLLEACRIKKVRKDLDGKEFLVNEEPQMDLVSCSDIEDFKQLLEDQYVNLVVEQNGNVRITYNDHDRDDDQDVIINVYGAEYQKPKISILKFNLIHLQKFMLYLD